jgi:hypothetical protein
VSANRKIKSTRPRKKAQGKRKRRSKPRRRRTQDDRGGYFEKKGKEDELMNCSEKNKSADSAAANLSEVPPGGDG